MKESTVEIITIEVDGPTARLTMPTELAMAIMDLLEIIEEKCNQDGPAATAEQILHLI